MQVTHLNSMLSRQRKSVRTSMIAGIGISATFFIMGMIFYRADEDAHPIGIAFMVLGGFYFLMCAVPWLRRVRTDQQK
jgi:hypothetical protein